LEEKCYIPEAKQKEMFRLMVVQIFSSNFIIAVKEWGKAVRLLEMKLGGKVEMISPTSKANLDSLFKQYKPSHAKTTGFSHGGEIILYGKFA